MSLGIRYLAEQVREAESDDITNMYSAFGIPLEHPIIFISFVNTTDQTVFVSLDGDSDHFVIGQGMIDGVAGSTTLTIHLGTLRQANGEQCQIAKNTQFYVRAAADPAEDTSVFMSVGYLKEQ